MTGKSADHFPTPNLGRRKANLFFLDQLLTKIATLSLVNDKRFSNWIAIVTNTSISSRQHLFLTGLKRIMYMSNCYVN